MKRTRPMRAELPIDVWDRFAEEAAEHGVSVGTYLRQLIVARDEKRQARAASPSSKPSNRE